MEQEYTVTITEPAQRQLQDIMRYIADELQAPSTASHLFVRQRRTNDARSGPQPFVGKPKRGFSTV